MKQIFFVRHAESESNVNTSQKTANVASVQLSEKGREQAKELVKQIPFVADLVVVSPYIRTRQTADPYIVFHKVSNIEVWDVHEFTYLSQKKYNGTTREERVSATDTYWRREDIHYKDAEDAESFDEFIQRLVLVREKLLSRREEKAVVFSHGYVIPVFKIINKTLLDGGVIDEAVANICMAAVNPLKEGYDSRVKNASVHQIKVLQ